MLPEARGCWAKVREGVSLCVDKVCLGLDKVRERAAKVYETVRYAWAFCLATYRVSVLHRFMCTREFWIYKVCAINEDDGSCVSVTKMFRPEAWEESVRVATGWKLARFRADVRYLAHGKKFRLVLRPGDTCTFPPCAQRHRGGPKGVMAAELCGPEATINITPRVLKYQGPLKDFHQGLGLRVGVVDMFPFDDPEELDAHFESMRLVDAQARTVDVPLSCADVASALASGQKRD